jgi:hypothetical protein
MHALEQGRLRLPTSPCLTGSVAGVDHDGNLCGRGLGSSGGSFAADRDDDSDLAANKIGRQRRHPVVLALGPAILDRDVAALDEAGFLQAPSDSLAPSRSTFHVTQIRTSTALGTLGTRMTNRYIIETIAMAEEEASAVADEDVSDEPVDRDWFTRWRANAEEVRDEEIRSLWARILAGEVQRPGRFSLHTLDFMRRLSREDAELIARLAPFVTAERDLFLRHGDLDPVLAKYQLRVHELMELQNLGVLSGVGGNLSKDLDIESTVTFRFQNKIIRADRPPARLILPLAGVTKVGAQVMSLGNFQANEEYVLAVAGVIRGQGFTVSLGDVREDGGFDMKPFRGPQFPFK